MMLFARHPGLRVLAQNLHYSTRSYSFSRGRDAAAVPPLHFTLYVYLSLCVLIYFLSSLLSQ
jgi:hypothetical protein